MSNLEIVSYHNLRTVPSGRDSHHHSHTLSDVIHFHPVPGHPKLAATPSVTTSRREPDPECLCAARADERSWESCDTNARGANANRPSLLLPSDSSPIMSQTMEHTDSSSIRENEEPDKKQKSRRPPSTCAGRDCVAKVALLMNGG